MPKGIMMRKSFFLSTTFAALLGFSQWASAAVMAQQCNGCTEGQYNSLATSLAMAAGQATGQRYIYDLTNGNLRAFDIEREPNGAGGFMYFAVPRDLTSDQVGAFADLKSSIAENGGSSTFHFSIDAATMSGFPYPNISGFDFASSNMYRDNIAYWIPNGAGSAFANNVTLSINGLIDALSKVILDGTPFNFTVTITFVDGSKTVYTYQANSAKAVLIDLHDVNGNVIPLTAEEGAPNNYHFPHGGGEAMAGFLEGYLQYEITGNICVNGTLACVISGSGENTIRTCQWFSCNP